ncbi:MAG TPA: CdaR family protein [Longimicrobiales bacterium]|nr:CdaR family protein [Longimicrobiales bacterium]
MLRRVIDWATNDWALKLTALVLAFLMWVTVRADEPGQWSWEVPVRVINNDADWVVSGLPVPAEVTLYLRGPYRELLRASSDLPEIIVPIQEVQDSSEVVQLRSNWVSLPSGTDQVTVVDILPSSVRIAFDLVTTMLIPVAAPLLGEPPPGYELIGDVVVEPAVVRASGASRAIARVDSLRLPPIDLSSVRTYDTLQLTIDTTGTGLMISPRTVRVFIPIGSVVPDTGGAVTPRVPPPDQN